MYESGRGKAALVGTYQAYSVRARTGSPMWCWLWGWRHTWRETLGRLPFMEVEGGAAGVEGIVSVTLR
jgi:hypothetical protein